MNNMDLYNRFGTTPPEACRTIKGGSLNGFTDVNPMYRIKRLTEAFGPCGIGWYIQTVEHWQETSEATKEVCCYVRINLFINVGGQWSMPIEGIGGSKIDQSFSKGFKTSDEAYKMATTDAISVACKMLGIASDIYWSADKTKYSNNEPAPANDVNKEFIKPADINAIRKLIAEKKVSENAVLQRYKITSFEQMRFGDFTNAMNILQRQ